MKKTIAILLTGLALMALVTASLTGCANTPTDPGVIAYDVEKSASDTATAGTHTFNVYYAQQVAGGLTTNELASLNATRQQIYTVDTNLESGLLVVDSLRTNYVATGETNASLAAALSAALATVQSQSSVITNLVNTLK